MIKEAIEKIAKKIDLDEGEAYLAFGEIMSGRATPAQIASLLTALAIKGEAIEEITGAVKAMREKSLKINVQVAGKLLVDTCGTGGSGINTFNISTVSAFVAAGAGVRIAKHGNRAASGQCGSADLLEALGVKIEISPDLTARCIDEIGIGFMFAPLYHSAMKYAIGPRREIGVRTIFNILGPLSNPASAGAQVLGVYDAKLTEVMAKVLKKTGTSAALVVHGMDSLDEITITARTKITELKKGKIKSYYITPEKFGMSRATLGDIKGGDAKENAEIAVSILKGAIGPRRDIVLLNTAAAITLGLGSARDLKEGIALAAESIDSGKAFGKLSELIRITNQ